MSVSPAEPARRTSGVPPLRRRAPAPPPSAGGWRRAVNFLLLFVTVVLLVDALVGDKGLLESLRARRDARDLAARVDRLRAENERLRLMNQRLADDPRTVEDIARRDLGFIRPGEVVFIIKDVKPPRPAPPGPPPPDPR